MYGTLSHSHLLLVLLCLSSGAEWELPEQLQKLFDQKGATIYSAVAEMDEHCAALCNEGLEM